MFPLAFFGSPQDIAIIGVVVLLLFGGSKLAGFGKSLGEGIKEFKKATNDDDAAIPVAATSPSVITPPVVAGTTSEEK